MFRNPLHGRPFADPFVLKFNGRYYAYGTPKSGGLPVLASTDLVSWQEAGEVSAPPAPGQAHWAPEVAYHNGRFFLYHSTGGHEGENHQVRVAAGTSPTGPFDDDLGLLDPDDPFTIDAHPFRDDDGQWYLFYSRDFLDGEPVGTGIVVDRLVDMTALAGEQTVVMRPHSEWHLYERQRRWYDRVWDWYTVEGPFVRKHEGRYWCFYSGGAWKAENYGISSAVADHPMGPYEPVVAADTADVLRTVPGRVIGPGHGSVALAPDNLTEYLLYHAWDLEHTGRFLHADRLTWDDGRPHSPGPRTEPQPSPPEPLFRDFVDERRADGRQAGGWVLQDGWTVTPRDLRHPGGRAPAAALVDVTTPATYLFEANLAMSSRSLPQGRAGVVISHRDDDNHTVVWIEPGTGELTWHAVGEGQEQGGGVLAPLPKDFAVDAYHQVFVHRGVDRAAVTLDGTWMGSLPAPPSRGGRVGLWAAQAAVRVEGVALTELH